MELTPRSLEGHDHDRGDGEGPGTERPRRRRRRWLPLVVVGVVLVALGALVYQGLSEATLYFRNVDEAVAERDSLGTRRFRLQGTVVGEPERVGGAVSFTVAHGGVSTDVRHVGDPPELFREDVAVVLEGRWAEGEDVFDSDRILVKHDEEYESREDYEQRVREAEEGGGGAVAGDGEDPGGS